MSKAKKKAKPAVETKEERAIISLINRGKRKDKELTQQEILDYLESIKLHEDYLDQVIEGLLDAGIEVIEDDQDQEVD